MAETPVAPASASVPLYVEPNAQLRSLVTRFVTIALGYDSTTEAQRDFLGRLNGIATGSEQRRLQASGRAQLRWPVLQQRAERATVQVTGVSQSPATDDDRVHLEVEAVRVTRSTVAEVRDFVAVTLVLIQTPAGWRVDGAVGGGL